MDKPIEEWKAHDGSFIVWIDDEQGQCTDGVRACAILDVYPRTESLHCGCKGEQIDGGETILKGFELMLEGEIDPDEIAVVNDSSPEEFEVWLHTKPE